MATEIIEHVWIPMSDGTRLSARIFLPDGSGGAPAPAILEYIPYRKRDGTRGRDAPMHGYFVQQGYAAVRVDIRGTGDSEGHMADEYLELEQDDAVEVIAWIAAQDWCDGNVGMMGKSWSGFNSLQVAARRPPALKAIITCYSTDDRFKDDIHFMNGCLLNDNLWWGSIMMAYQARPQDPEVTGEAWRGAWEKRLDDLPFFPALWAEHQSYDDYWKHGSVQEDYSAITCPVLVVGAWADSYTNSVPRLLENLTVPSRGIIGPWGHVYPHDGAPGPAIGFLQEATRWWDQWLRGRDTGVMEEPKLRAYINDPVAPNPTRPHQPGRWVGSAWPLEEPMQQMHLGGNGTLGDRAEAPALLPIRSPQSHGIAAGEWMAVGCPGEMPADQRIDDGGALTFDTPVLEEDLEILGVPELDLHLASDKAVAQVVVRIGDVAPDGQITRVTYQVLNLTHRDGHANPETAGAGPVRDGEGEAVGLRSSLCRRSPAASFGGHCLLADHLALARGRNADHRHRRLGAASAGARGGDSHPGFEPPAHGIEVPVTMIRPATLERTATTDFLTGEVTYVTDGQGGLFGEGVLRFDEVGTVLSHSLRRELKIHPDDPATAAYRLSQVYEMGRDGWQTVIQLETEMTSDRDSFFLKGRMDVSHNGEPVRTRTWDKTLPRNLI